MLGALHRSGMKTLIRILVERHSKNIRDWESEIINQPDPQEKLPENFCYCSIIRAILVLTKNFFSREWNFTMIQEN